MKRMLMFAACLLLPALIELTAMAIAFRLGLAQ
jgi:hypothetical protein